MHKQASQSIKANLVVVRLPGYHTETTLSDCFLCDLFLFLRLNKNLLSCYLMQKKNFSEKLSTHLSTENVDNCVFSFCIRNLATYHINHFSYG